MNKAFVREPDLEGEAYCPKCGSLGATVRLPAMEAHVQPGVRVLSEAAWYCSFARCDVVYFDTLEATITVDQLREPVYPKDLDAPICPCFGFTRDDVEADVREGQPTRIRQLLAKSQSPQARCGTRAVDGRCCMREVQRLYIKLRET